MSVGIMISDSTIGYEIERRLLRSLTAVEVGITGSDLLPSDDKEIENFVRRIVGSVSLAMKRIRPKVGAIIVNVVLTQGDGARSYLGQRYTRYKLSVIFGLGRTYRERGWRTHHDKRFVGCWRTNSESKRYLIDN